MGLPVLDAISSLYDLDTERFSANLNEAVEAWSSTDKGSALEDVARILISSVRLFTYRDQNLMTVDSGELDLTYTVVPALDFEDWGKLLLVECKNWNSRVTMKEVLAFGMKLIITRAKVGLLVTQLGVTGSHEAHAQNAIDRIYDVTSTLILVLTFDDLRSIAAGASFYELLRLKEYELRVRRR